MNQNRISPTLAAILLVLWLFALVSGYTMASFIHLLLAIAVLTLLFKPTAGRKRR